MLAMRAVRAAWSERGRIAVAAAGGHGGFPSISCWCARVIRGEPARRLIGDPLRTAQVRAPALPLLGGTHSSRTACGRARNSVVADTRGGWQCVPGTSSRKAVTAGGEIPQDRSRTRSRDFGTSWQDRFHLQERTVLWSLRSMSAEVAAHPFPRCASACIRRRSRGVQAFA